MNAIQSLVLAMIGIFVAACVGFYFLLRMLKYSPCVRKGWFREAPANCCYIKLNNCHFDDPRAPFQMVLARPGFGKLYNLSPFWNVVEECPSNVLVSNHSSLLFVPDGYEAPPSKEDHLIDWRKTFVYKYFCYP